MKTVVRTNGSPGVVVLGAGVVSGVDVELDDEDETTEVDEVELVGVTPRVVTPMVSS